ncbi:uncharacterized protein LOC127011831 [Drosophila biarmipes]|uniref:uncharacterized protein LOC127011831 n=1 Tax=Drosophila biarmipes TaxID=125945 RepID=UPI0021CD0C08|nr:uncharacterized protein LOC127011831 [Drosophila biarmipes]
MFKRHENHAIASDTTCWNTALASPVRQVELSSFCRDHPEGIAVDQPAVPGREAPERRNGQAADTSGTNIEQGSSGSNKTGAPCQRGERTLIQPEPSETPRTSGGDIKDNRVTKPPVITSIPAINPQ